MNWLAVLLDLFLVGVIALCAWRGNKNGIIVSVLSIAGIMACICAGNVMAETYDDEFASVPQSVGSGLVDSYATKLLTADYSEIIEGEDDDLVIRLTNEQKNDVHAVSYAVCRQLGFADGVSNDIADRVSAQTGIVNQAMSHILGTEICLRVSHVAIFAIVFLLTIIILAAVKNTLDLYLSLPGLEVVNRILGAVLGGFKGLLYVLLFTAVLRYAGLLVSDEVLQSSLLAKALTEHNTIANILGI